MTHASVFRLAIACMAGAVLACGSDVTAPSASTLTGDWTRLDEIPGSSERWTLAVNGSAITGTGTWSGEACCSGPLVLNGTIVGDSIHVDVALTIEQGAARPAIHEHFDGALTSRATLGGMVSFESGAPGEVRMQKQ